MDSDVLKLFGIMMALGLSGATVYVVIALVGALVRRLDRGGAPDAAALQAELDDLRARMEDGEATRARLVELEERLEFAERLLARQRDPARLAPGGEGPG